jgi:phosphoglycolate phosphatase
MIDNPFYVVFDCDGTLVDTSGSTFFLYPGIRELLEDLCQDCELYVWTNRDRKSLVRMLKDFGVLAYFKNMSTIDEHLPKPDVGGLDILVSDRPKSRVWVIGDTSLDILGNAL